MTAAFGEDEVALTLHYVTNGKAEGRELTTIPKALAARKNVCHYNGESMAESYVVAKPVVVKPVVSGNSESEPEVENTVETVEAVETVEEVVVPPTQYLDGEFSGGTIYVTINGNAITYPDNVAKFNTETVNTGDTIHIPTGSQVTVYKYASSLGQLGKEQAIENGTKIIDYSSKAQTFIVESGYSYYIVGSPRAV